MSHEIVKRLRIESGKVFITADSNNVYPKHFVEREDVFLTRKLQDEGEEALNIYILDAYASGMFQKGNPNKWSNAIERLQRTPEYENYNWRKSSFDKDCQIYKNLYNEDKTAYHKLLLSSLNLKEQTEMYIVKKSVQGRESYVSKVTTRLIKYSADKAEAKLFKFKDQAEYIANMFDFLEIIKVNSKREEIEAEPVKVLIPECRDQLQLF